MNTWTGIGFIGRDIELRYSAGDEPFAIARFQVGIKRPKSDEWDNINCVAFRQTAETAEKYCHKGSRVGITGHIQTGSYDKNVNGETIKIYTTDVIVDKLDFCDRKEGSQQESNHQEEQQIQGFSTLDEDIPF